MFDFFPFQNLPASEIQSAAPQGGGQLSALVTPNLELFQGRRSLSTPYLFIHIYLFNADLLDNHAYHSQCARGRTPFGRLRHRSGTQFYYYSKSTSKNNQLTTESRLLIQQISIFSLFLSVSTGLLLWIQPQLPQSRLCGNGGSPDLRRSLRLG